MTGTMPAVLAPGFCAVYLDVGFGLRTPATEPR